MASSPRMGRRPSYAYPEPPGTVPMSLSYQNEPSSRPLQEGRLSVSPQYGPTGPISIDSSGQQYASHPLRQRALSSPNQQWPSMPAFWPSAIPPTEPGVYNSSVLDRHQQRPSPITSLSSGSSPTFSYRDAPMGSSPTQFHPGMMGTSPPASYLPTQGGFPTMTRAHSSSAAASYGPSLHPVHALQPPVEQPVAEEKSSGHPNRPRQQSSSSQRSMGARSNTSRGSRRGKADHYSDNDDYSDYDSDDSSEDERQRRRRSRRRERARSKTKAYDDIDDRRPTMGDSVSVVLRHAREFLSSRRS